MRTCLTAALLAVHLLAACKPGPTPPPPAPAPPRAAGPSTAAPTPPPEPAPRPAPVDPTALSPAAQQARNQAIDAFVVEALSELRGASLEDARGLAPVLKDEVSRLDNPHVEGAQIEVHALVFEGLRLKAWIQADGKLSPAEADVTGARWRVRDGLGVGASTGDLLRVLGPPDQVRGDVLEYSGETETAAFTVRDGRVTRLLLTYYWD